METPIKFSVVTPNYNMGEYLEKTILSVLENLNEDDEYIIVDANSTDNSIDIINKYLSKIKLIREPDDGYSEAIHKGFSIAKNQYYCWINSGDTLLEGSLEKARQYFKKDYDFLYGNDLHIDEFNKIIGYSFGHVLNFNQLMLYGGWTPLQDACFWKATAYWKINGIDSNYKFAADFDFFLRLSENSKMKYVNHFFSAFRKHDGQKSISGKQEYSKERKKSQSNYYLKNNISKNKVYILRIIYFIYLRIHTFAILPIMRNYYKIKFIKKNV